MIDVIWDLDDDPGDNVSHIPIDEYLTKDDVSHAVNNAIDDRLQAKGGRRILLGLTADGGLLFVVYEPAGSDAIYPITSFFAED